MTYDDTYLLAYLNGDLTSSQATKIETALKVDPDLERRLMSLDPLAQELGASFEQIAAYPPVSDMNIDVPSLNATSTKMINPIKYGMMAACLIGGIALGVIGSQLGKSQSALDWREEVARYQALYITETLSSVKEDTVALDSQLARASAVINLDLSRDALSRISDLTLKRSQILGLEDNEIIQVAFSDPNGTPYAFCFTKTKGSHGKTITSETMAGLSSASWGSDTHQFIIIGGQNDAKTAAIATELQNLFF